MDLRRLAKRFSKNRDGATAIEFALVGPMFLSLILGMSYHGLVSLQLAHLDFATYEAASVLRIANTTATDADSFKNLVMCPALSPVLSCEDISVGVDSTTTLADIGKWRGQNLIGKFCPGTAGSIIAVSTEYRITGPLRHFYFGSGSEDDGALTLGSRYFIVREPTVSGEGITC